MFLRIFHCVYAKLIIFQIITILQIHRRILKDDGFGVREPLNEIAYDNGLVVRGQHILIDKNLRNRDELFLHEKTESVKLSMRPWIFISPTMYSFEKWKQYYSMNVSIIFPHILYKKL